jgi:MFS transporter, OFA family, oxalate/formate antiporter
LIQRNPGEAVEDRKIFLPIVPAKTFLERHRASKPEKNALESASFCCKLGSLFRYGNRARRGSMLNRVFYGWWVLLGIFSCYAALVGVQVYTLPLFYPVLIKQLGWSSEDVTLPATIFFLTGAIITPFVSSLFDRYRVKLFMVAGAILTIVGLGIFRFIRTPVHMTAIFLILALSQVCCGQVPTMLVVTRWFRRYRGIAVGITLMGTSIGGAIFPLVVKHLLADGLWREAMSRLAIICALMMFFPLVFLVRGRPEDKNLQPDGTPSEPETNTRRTQASPAGPTLSQALRMPAFYLLAFATGALWLCINGVIQHQAIFINRELGLDMNILPVVISVFFWASIVGRLLIGYLGDRVDKTLIMLGAVINLIAGLLILRVASADHIASLYAYAIVYGIGFSGTFTMIQLVIAEFFAGQSYGKILGLLTMVDVAGGGLGIIAIAWMQGVFGSYLPVIQILIGVCCVVAVIIGFLYRMRLNIARQAKTASVV